MLHRPRPDTLRSGNRSTSVPTREDGNRVEAHPALAEGAALDGVFFEDVAALAVGYDWLYGALMHEDRVVIRIGEDIKVESSPDVSFQLALRYRPPAD